MIRSRYLLLTVCALAQAIVRGALYKIHANDTILFFGGMNTLIGASMPHGFANIFKTEVQAAYSNITVINGGYADLDGAHMYAKIDNILKSSKFKPSKVIFSTGIEVLKDRNDPSTHLKLRFELESVVARIVQDRIQVVLCPLPIQGERVDIEKELDDTIAAYVGMNKQVARDYDVMFVNLVPLMDQYWERNNVDKLSHSLLTVEGTILNEEGNTFVALALLRSLGVNKHSLVADNIVLREELRVHELKQELQRVQRIEEMSVSM